MTKKVIFWDLDGTLAKWNAQATMKDIVMPGYFANLAPEVHLVQLANMIASFQCCDSYVLSHYIPETQALADKKVWCKKYLPQIQPEHLLFVPCGVAKATYINDLMKHDIQDNYILIDDNSGNLRNWQAAGGHAVKWLNKINGVNQTFTGPRLDQAEKVAEEIFV